MFMRMLPLTYDGDQSDIGSAVKSLRPFDTGQDGLGITGGQTTNFIDSQQPNRQSTGLYYLPAAPL